MRAKTLFISGALALLVGCSIPVPSQIAKSTCADTFAAQMVTAQVVPGAYDCLSSQGKAQFTSAADLAAYSKQEPFVQSMRYLGRADSGAYVYAARTSMGPALFLLSLDKNGKVANVRGNAA